MRPAPAPGSAPAPAPTSAAAPAPAPRRGTGIFAPAATISSKVTVSVTLVTLYVIHVSSTSTLTTITSVVPVSVALVALDVVHVGASVVASRTSGIRSSGVRRYFSSWSLSPLYFNPIPVDLSTVQLADRFFSVSAADKLDESVSEGSFGEPNFVQFTVILELLLHLPSVRIRT